MSDQSAAPGELVFTRILEAPRELVFRCMIEPEHLTHFWGPANQSGPIKRSLGSSVADYSARHALDCQPIVRLASAAGRSVTEPEDAVDLVTELSTTGTAWQPRRLAAVEVELPGGVTPPGTRGRILRAALGLFSELGFHGTSIRQIASGVGINPATLYAHYPSKEHILAELVLLGHQELSACLDDALASAGPDPAARLAALVRAQVLVHAEFPLLAVVANTELHVLSGPHAAAPLELRARCRDLLAGVLAEGDASGAFAMVDPVLTGIALGGLGMQVAHWFRPDQPYSGQQVADAYAALALRMVGAHRTVTPKAGPRKNETPKNETPKNETRKKK